MTRQKINSPSLTIIFSKVIRSVKDEPKLIYPFAIFALLEAISLIILFLSPRMPFSIVLAPVIRAFWGEKFLHYPLNFMLLPKLASHAKMFLSVFFGSLLSGAAVILASEAYHKKKVELKGSFITAFKNYGFLFIIVLISSILFILLNKVTGIGLTKYFLSGHRKLLFLGPRIWLGPILLTVNFLFSILLQSVFIYSIPALMIDKLSLIKSIFKSWLLFKRNFIKTIIVVGLPALLYLPIIILQINTPLLINKVFPESVLFASFISIAVSTLVIDSMITIASTFLFIALKEE